MPAALEMANAIRALSMDAVEKAQSGHPGAPMGMADIAQVLWHESFNHNPANPNWPNRDRFILSNGHGSMLLYALLHLTGYDLSLEDIKQFRQLHSKTPGHPEYDMTPGVETTTGPLGQGLANGVGMALAERLCGAYFNRPGFDMLNHYTYVFVGDGCLMEGISHEVCSLAGTLALGKLIVFYDDNGISIDGAVSGWFRDDTPKRFEAYGWHVVSKVNGHDPQEIKAALAMAQAQKDQPSLICCQTIIGYGAPNKQGSADVHGKALGEEEINAARGHLNWQHPGFTVPEALYAAWDARQAGAEKEQNWMQLLDQYRQAHPALAAEFTLRLIEKKLPDSWSQTVVTLLNNLDNIDESLATRQASGQCLEILGPALPELMGGSADLTGSNNTLWTDAGDAQKSATGRYLYYGVREFGMSAIMNGMALYGGVIPYGGTFLVFSDYARNAVRLSALMKQRVIYVYSHDSIGLGEDGPTHQPVEHLASLRVIPQLSVWRPADAYETAVAWQAAIERIDGPTSLILSRQALPVLKRTKEQKQVISRGAYIVLEKSKKAPPDLIIIATGSEVNLAVAAGMCLLEEGHAVRVISMPSVDTFERQDAEYRLSILPIEVKARIAVEAGSTDYWRKYVGLEGIVVGLDRFGESARGDELFEYFGINEDTVVAAGRRLLAQFEAGIS